MNDSPILTVYEKPTCTTCRKLVKLLNALVQHPDLIQRPIIERGERAVLGRPVERVLELL